MFTGEERILVPLPRNPTAHDFFKLYITDQIIDHIVIQTNLYAHQFIEQHQNNFRPHSLVHQWKATDRAEILTLSKEKLLKNGKPWNQEPKDAEFVWQKEDSQGVENT